MNRISIETLTEFLIISIHASLTFLQQKNFDKENSSIHHNDHMTSFSLTIASSSNIAAFRSMVYWQ